MASRLRRDWVKMTTKDFQLTDMSKVIAVLPVAAIEQHGPHLPVEVDTAINRGVVDACEGAAAPRLPGDSCAAMPIGKSNEHISYPGTLTLSAETLIRLWTEIGESVEPRRRTQARAVQQPRRPAADRRHRRRVTCGAPRHVRRDRQHLRPRPAARTVPDSPS
jgi:hypothetical protein